MSIDIIKELADTYRSLKRKGNTNYARNCKYTDEEYFGHTRSFEKYTFMEEI